MKGVLIHKLQLYYKDEYIRLFQGDCLEVMDKLIEKGIKFDAVITDPPYGTTACKWDAIIPFDKMWDRLNKLTKNNSAIVLFAAQPFASQLINSNLKMFKYEIVWHKNTGCDYTRAKYKPLTRHENLEIFSKGTVGAGSKNPMKYYPQGLIEINKKTKVKNGGEKDVHRPGRTYKETEYVAQYTNYPTTWLDGFIINEKGLHPTQKSIELCEYIINTYTNENELILDFTCGSGTTLLAARNLKRKCIGIELEEKYCEIAKNRLMA